MGAGLGCGSGRSCVQTCRCCWSTRVMTGMGIIRCCGAVSLARTKAHTRLALFVPTHNVGSDCSGPCCTAVRCRRLMAAWNWNARQPVDARLQGCRVCSWNDAAVTMQLWQCRGVVYSVDLSTNSSTPSPPAKKFAATFQNWIRSKKRHKNVSIYLYHITSKEPRGAF